MVAYGPPWMACAPDFISTTAGGDSTTVPSAIALAPFAFVGSWIVARHGFGGE